MGNIGVINPGEIQAMSAGTGITHSEYNHSKSEPVNLLQIWVFPKERNIKPRYEQIKFDVSERQNKFQTIVAPEKSDRVMWINQDAWFSMANMDANPELAYKNHLKGSGVYVFVIEGKAEVAGKTVEKRDAIGITDTDSFSVKALEKSELLLIEVPMN
jgi:quercetin 2,3-dioxygenase